jgi:hypothetical protein
MHSLITLALIGTLAFMTSSASADVIRCADPAGKVSYTDGPCPTGARQVGQVAILQPATLTPEEIDQRDQAAQEAAKRAKAERSRPKRDPLAAAANPLPSGPAVIDPRASANVGGGDNLIAGDDGYGYGYGYAGGYRQPPTNLAPRMRKCDAKGCQDTMGNHYDTTGQVTSYRGPGGQTCRPVGTTVICK